MADWRDTILNRFEKNISRLTLVSDPDGLLTEERMLTEIKDRGFDLIPFEDSIAFRFAYESKYRSMWDQGQKTDLVVVLRSEHDLNSLPYDLLNAGRKLEFSLHKLFPHLNYPVVESLDASLLDSLYTAYQQQHDSVLGERATKDFVLRSCFRLEPSLISTPVDLLKVLLSIHYQGTPLPNMLNNHLLETLRSIPAFAEWPLDDILPHQESFLHFLQKQWTQYLDALRDKGGGCLLPFDHQDVRAYVDTFFMEGLLKPAACEGVTELPAWVHVGIKHDPQADALKRLRALMDRSKEKMPTDDSPHRDWQKFARTWAESVVLRWELDAALEAEERDCWGQLHADVEDRFAAWMENRFASLHNLPFVPQPVMVHHVGRYLASIRADQGLKKLALVIMDGLSLDQWLVLRSRLETQRDNWRLEESTVFAWVPSLTSISRQSIFAAEPPLYYPDSLETTYREPKHWSRFWEDQDVNGEAVEYAKMVESGKSEALDTCLGNPHVAVVGIVVNTVDKIMHGEQQGTAGMHDAIRLWSDDAISLIDRLFDEGFEVFMTADHGNIAADGIGTPKEGVLVEVAGKRARIYDNPNFRAEAKSDYPESIEWPNIGLPQDRHVLLPKGLRAFTAEDKHVVSHGGISLEEIIVPFVRFTRDE